MEPVVHKTTQSSNENPDYSEKALDAQIEREDSPVAPARGGFLHKTKRHCARFWWVHLIIFCIVFLIIALCLVYVAMPKIAQDGVTDSTITLTELRFEEPESEALVITQKGKIHNPTMYTPTLDPFSVHSFLVTNGTYGAEYMLDLAMPKIHVLKNVNVSTATSRIEINSLEAVTDYCIAVLTQENVTSALVGKTDLHLGKLPKSTVKYNKTTTYKGLNGLKGFNVTDSRLNLTASPNLRANAFIPNPSVLTIEMGNVTLSLSTAQKGIVGNATILEMTIRPGDNILPMTAFLNQADILGSMDAKTGIVELQIEGISSIRNGQHLTYYERALKVNKLFLNMNVTQIILDSQ